MTKPLIFFDNESYGILENLIATGIFASPNILLVFEWFRTRYLFLTFYNIIVIFLVITSMSHFRFRNFQHSQSKKSF